jgi:hypothetical protein
MPRAIEIIAGFATNPSTTLTTLTMSTSLSATVRGTDTTKGTWLLSGWAFNATAGTLRVTSPRLHDQSQGIRNRVTANNAMPLICGPYNAAYAQRLYAQDALTIQLSGGGAEIDTAALLIGYDDLTGVAGRFIDQPTLKKNGINIVTAEVTVTATTDGKFGGAVAINATNDNLIANTDYAVLGMMTDTRGGALRITAVDFGNLGVGCPAEPSSRHLTQNFFEQLSIAFNAPYIPVFNSANKTTTQIDVQSNGSGGTYIVDVQLVQLAPNAVPTTSATAAGQQPGQ